MIITIKIRNGKNNNYLKIKKDVRVKKPHLLISTLDGIFLY